MGHTKSVKGKGPARGGVALGGCESLGRMKWVGVVAVVALLTTLPGGYLRASAQSASAPGWAVIIENDSYAGRHRELPVAYINSTRILRVLTHRGWPADHVLLVRDSLDPQTLNTALGWLAARVRPGELALFYVAGEYQFFARDLHWSATVPALWRRVPTMRRVMIVETCFAERLADANRGIPGLALAAVGRDEWDWWGLRDNGPVMRGAPFTYFLANALNEQAQDATLDFETAFVQASADVQAYFHDVIVTTPGALDAFHAISAYPERLPIFPNPQLVEEAETTGSSPTPPPDRRR